jgi:small multidrug resistance family-3 protein
MSLAYFALAALCEIAGCYAFWLWVREDKNGWWLGPGVAALIAFAWLLTKVDSAYAGRAYAAYGGIYIGASLLWLWLIDGQRPTIWDWIGSALCLAGMVVIIFGNRA